MSIKVVDLLVLNFTYILYFMFCQEKKQSREITNNLAVMMFVLLFYTW